MKLLSTTVVPGSKRVILRPDITVEQQGYRFYTGPETNYIPHRIVAFGICEQQATMERLDQIFSEGWMWFELEGGLVVGQDDPALRDFDAARRVF